MTFITILCGGSRGDNQPYIALGAGLRAAGYRVRIVADPEFEPMAVAHGLEFASTGVDPRAFVEEHMAGVIDAANPLAALRQMRKVQPLMKAGEDVQARAWWEACQGADAVIGHALNSAFGLSAARKLGIPYIEADVKPMVPTRAYPSTALPPIRLGGALNRLSHRLFEQGFWQMQRASMNRWLKEMLDQPPLPSGGYWRLMEQERTPRLCGVSPHVIPRPADWDDHIHMTGYWIVEQAETYQPPATLVDFLAAGPPPVYIGFGSMPSLDPAATTALVVRALDMAGQRGILLRGYGGLANAGLPESVFFIDSVPHDWLFPHMSAVAHHGGAGTTAAGLRSGVPSFAIPMMGDQPFWGHRIHELGAGPKPIPRRQLTAERLAEAIRIAVTDRSMQDRAAELGEKIRAEDGVANAVEVIHRALQSPLPD